MPLSPYLDFSRINGVCNTVKDPIRIPTSKSGVYLAIGENIDIDDEKMAHRRKGLSERLYQGSFHSAWANNEIFLCVKGDVFYRYFPESNSLLPILAGISVNGPMQYVDINGTVYFANKAIVGYIENGEPHPFPDPNMNFKKRMVGGQLLEYYNSRLYAAQNDKLFFSDAQAFTRMDARKNFIEVPGYVTMTKAVTDGMYVGAGRNVFFFAGGDPDEFVSSQVSDEPVIMGSAIRVDGEEIGPGLVGPIALWCQADGIFMGLPGGQVKEVTSGNYSLPEVDEATAVYRDDLGFSQYLMMYSIREGTEGMDQEVTLPSPVVHLILS